MTNPHPTTPDTREATRLRVGHAQEWTCRHCGALTHRGQVQPGMPEIYLCNKCVAAVCL